jgi:hypothetical protein
MAISVTPRKDLLKTFRISISLRMSSTMAAIKHIRRNSDTFTIPSRISLKIFIRKKPPKNRPRIIRGLQDALDSGA